MQTGFYLLIGVIGVSPALLFLSSPIVNGLLVAYTAVTVAIIGLSIRPGEASYITRIVRPIFFCALILAVWILVQTIPLQIISTANPIWISAQAALDRSILASISVDRGSTLTAFISYGFAVSVIFISATVTVDRSRADYLLFWLAAITTLASIVLVALQLGAVKSLFPNEYLTRTDPWITLTAIGVIVNAAASIRAIERYETRRSSHTASFSRFFWTLAGCLAAAAFCAVSIIALAPIPIVFATVFGSATFGVVTLIRRLGLGPWVNGVIALTVIVVGLVVIVTNWDLSDLTIWFASHSSPATSQIIQSILSDTRWTGNGAGTFGVLAPIYQNIDQSISAPYAPTSAATIAIELGRPALYVILLIILFLLVQLLRGALQRGRDSFYPTAGASCIVLLTLGAFCDVALLEKTTTIVACAVIGLALAQSVSRTNQTG